MKEFKTIIQEPHFKMSELFANFKFTDEELSNIEKGPIRILDANTIDQNIIDDFITELNAIQFAFKEIVDNFFQEPLTTLRGDVEWIDEIRSEMGIIRDHANDQFLPTASVNDVENMTRKTKLIHSELKKIRETMERYMRYLSVMENMSSIDTDVSNNNYEEIIDKIIFTIDNFCDVIDENNIAKFSADDLMIFKESAMSQIRNGKDIITVAKSEHIDETKIDRLQKSVNKLMLFTMQINMATN